MGLIINTNNPALKTTNILSKNNKKAQKTTEKLASGYKINRAGDDASGLAISEKMRNQITALDTTIDGDEDAVNLINTAEGYFNEIQDMIVRMTELTVKSSNGILQDNPDRLILQDEVDQLSAEIDRIATTANFNGIKLLSGAPTEKVITTRTVTVAETIPNSNYIKDVKSLSAGQLIKDGNEYETVKFLADAATKYLSDNNYDKKALNDKAIFYTENGENYIVAPKDSNPDDIKTQLGLDPSDVLMKTETNNMGVVDSYNVEIPEEKFIDGDTTGSATVNFVSQAIDQYKAGKDDLNCLVGKCVYYSDDGKAAFVGEKGMSRIDIETSLRAVNGSVDSSKFKSENILTADKRYPYYTAPAGRQITEEKEVKIPLTLKIGETSTNPDKIDLELYDLHTDKLFEPQYEQVITGTHTETKEITISPSRPSASIGGNMSQSNEYTHGGGSSSTYTTIVTTNTYEYIPVNETKPNNESVYNNATSIDIRTQDKAIKNIDYIKKVTNKVSDIRGDYAAKQNRIEHTIKDLTVTSENTSAAKSRISDTDMAREITLLTSQNIMNQASQSMLAQANSQPQSVMSLLQQ